MSAMRSIRSRLSSALIVISLAWGVAVSAAVGWVVQHEVDELLDNTLQESAEILLGILSMNAAQLPLGGGAAMAAPPHQEHMVWQIVDANGEVQLRSHRAPDIPLGVARSAGFSTQGEAWRVFALPFDSAGRVLYTAQIGEERRDARLEAIQFSMGAALAVGLAGALWLRIRIRLELEPITKMSDAVLLFDPLHARQTLDVPERTELQPMHLAITNLGDRLARQVANERAFAAHAAHALRTPLAAMVVNLAVAQRRAGPAEQDHLQRAREAANRLSRVVTALLTMFRSGGELTRQFVSIGELMTELPFGNLSLVVEDVTEVSGDPDLLAAAFMNLLDNAQRHGSQTVTVTTRRDASHTWVRLHDDGSGIDEPDRQRLQAALNSQNYDGQTGLGLMLADIVARAHGGQLKLPEATSGCVVEMSFKNLA